MAQDGIGLPQHSTIITANYTSDVGRFAVPAYSTVGIETTGDLTEATGYLPNGGSYYPQVIASFQEAPEITTLTYTLQAAYNPINFQFLVNRKFTDGDDLVWYPTIYKTVVSNEITDSQLIGLTLDDIPGIVLISSSSNSPSVDFKKTTIGTPVAGEAKFDFTLGKVTFAADIYNGKQVALTLPVTDATNIRTVGGPGATPLTFNEISSAVVMGMATSYLLAIIPKAIKSSAYSLTAGARNDVSFTARAVVDVANGYSQAVAYNAIDDTAEIGLV